MTRKVVAQITFDIHDGIRGLELEYLSHINTRPPATLTLSPLGSVSKGIKQLMEQEVDRQKVDNGVAGKSRIAILCKKLELYVDDPLSYVRERQTVRWIVEALCELDDRVGKFEGRQ